MKHRISLAPRGLQRRPERVHRASFRWLSILVRKEGIFCYVESRCVTFLISAVSKG